MQGKRKYLLILLFLLIGLGVYTFANPNEEERAEGKEQTPTNENTTVDNERNPENILERSVINALPTIERTTEDTDLTTPIVAVNQEYVDGGVLVTLTSNVPLRTPTGWNSINNRTFTRMYTTSNEYEVNVIALNNNRSVVSFSIDLDAPIVTILGSNPVYVLVGEEYSDEGATAYDVVDENVGLLTSYSVNYNVAGSYEIAYSAEDSNGNITTPVKRMIYVLDPEEDFDKDGYTNKEEIDNGTNPLDNSSTPVLETPIITILGKDSVVIEHGENYVELGAVSIDSIGKELDVVTDCDVTIESIGIYYCTYSVIDREGNVGEATRTVVIEDTNAPTVEISSPEEGSFNPTEFTVKAVDNNQLRRIDYSIYTNNNKDRIIIDGEWLDVLNTNEFIKAYDIPTLEDGEYTLRVTVSDIARNIVDAKSVNFIVDKNAPTVIFQTRNHETNTHRTLVSGDYIYSNVESLRFNASDASPFKLVLKNTGMTRNAVKEIEDSGFIQYFIINNPGLEEYIFYLEDIAGNKTEDFIVRIERTQPEITIKEVSIGSVENAAYSNVSFKLYDNVGISHLELNGVLKELTVNKWSDLNGVVPGKFGAKEGKNTLVVHDISGNSVSYQFVIDTIAPNIAIKLNNSRYLTNGQTISKVSNPVIEVNDSNPDYIAVFNVEGNKIELNTNDISHLADGTYRLVAYDIAGNASNEITFTMESTPPATTLIVSDVVDGKFNVSGLATDNAALNRVYVQLVSRVTGKRCGGTTIHMIRELQKAWSVSYDIKEFNETLCPAGDYAAHVKVVDMYNNRTDVGWTTNFLVKKIEDKPDYSKALTTL